MNEVKHLLRLIRPYQWSKNIFVFLGLIFGHAWNDIPLLINVILTAIAFSFVSSTVYIINDIYDVEHDRYHPKKKNRPIASGKVSIRTAILLAILTGLIGFGLGSLISFKVVIILITYLLLNIAYSLQWKKIVILDVFCIAAGFMLRILAGTIGVGIPPSKWLLLCSLLLTLFLGFAKRRAEILSLKKDKEEFREVLNHYDPLVLDEIIAICATGVIISYSLYTMSSETILIHRTESLIYTVPFVIYALFRYIFLLHHLRLGGEPSLDLFKDRHIIYSAIGWVVLTVCIIIRASLR